MISVVPVMANRGAKDFIGSDATANAIIKDETIWITQKAMAELFGVKVPNCWKLYLMYPSSFLILIKINSLLMCDP